jgi:hypothetical protein
MNVRLINGQNRYDLLVGYVHKIFAPDVRESGQLTYQDLFHLCDTYGIPLILEVPTDLQGKASELLGNPSEIVRFVDPKDVVSAAFAVLDDD